MATTHSGPINLNLSEQADFNHYVQYLDDQMRRRRCDPSIPRPVSFMEALPSSVTDQVIEALRRHYKTHWGVQANRRFQLAHGSPAGPAGEDPLDWILNFVSHI
jgi:hypothetical protein